MCVKILSVFGLGIIMNKITRYRYHIVTFSGAACHYEFIHCFFFWWFIFILLPTSALHSNIAKHRRQKIAGAKKLCMAKKDTHVRLETVKLPPSLMFSSTLYFAYIHDCMRPCTYIYIEHKYLCMYTTNHICIYIYILAHININTYIHTYIHTYMHTYIHTYVHTYIHT